VLQELQQRAGHAAAAAAAACCGQLASGMDGSSQRCAQGLAQAAVGQHSHHGSLQAQQQGTQQMPWMSVRLPLINATRY
jgi:hypothetical protein